MKIICRRSAMPQLSAYGTVLDPSSVACPGRFAIMLLAANRLPAGGITPTRRLPAHPAQKDAGTDLRTAATWPSDGRRRFDMHGRTRPERIQRSATDARGEALFVSALQPSDAPTADMIAGAITSSMHRFGQRGCAARMAQEFGDHPEAAAARMRWARQLAA